MHSSDLQRAGGIGQSPSTRVGPAEVHLLDRLRAFRRYRYVAAGIFVIVLAGATLLAYLQTPLYRATVRLLIEIEDERSLAMEGVSATANSDYVQDPEPYFQTQYRILTGRDLARRASTKLGLTHHVEFSDAGAPKSGMRRVLSAARSVVAVPFRALTGRASPPEGTGQIETPEDTVVDRFASRVTVDPVRASRLVDVSFVATDAQLAARAANTLAEEYVQQNLELRRQNMARSLDWLADELTRQKQTVEASERAMAVYREQQNALSLEDRQNIVIARLNQLNDAATRARTIRAQKEALYRRVATLSPMVSVESIPEILQNEYIQSIKGQVAELQRRKAILSERYGDKHPEILTITASMNDANRQLDLELKKALDAIKHEYESALLEERTLTSALDEQKTIATELDRKNVTYTVLQRDAESNRELYQTLLRREKELQVLANSRGNNVRLIELAGVPGGPFSPNLRRSVMLGSFAALIVALGLVLLLDYIDDTIKTPEDLTRRLGLPFLGLIPAVRGQHDRPVLSWSDDFGEAIRSLRTSIALSNTSDGSSVVLVTSAQPLEGKTTTACNLATALAYGGARVLLIDADMRRPGVHAGFGLDNACGLSDVLSGQAPLTAAVRRLAEPQLWVMPAGTVPPNPSELLGSRRMDAFMTQVHEGPFDWIIIDTPPVLAVTDASILTRWVTGVVFVVGAEMTRRRHAERAIETLAAGRAQILGTVLNRVDVTTHGYYTTNYEYRTDRLAAEGRA